MMSYSDTSDSSAQLSAIELEPISACPPASIQDLGPYQKSVSFSHQSHHNVEYEYGINSGSVPLSTIGTQSLDIEPEKRNFSSSNGPRPSCFRISCQRVVYRVFGLVTSVLLWSFPQLLHHGSRLETVSLILLALVGSLSSSVLFLSSPIVLPITNRFPRHKRAVMISGILLSVSGLVGAAFSTKIWHLIITQGIMYSLGGSLLYFPTTTYIFEWFSQKRGIASGVIYSGTSVGGVVTPFIIEILLNKYGRRTTLLSLAVAFLTLAVPCLPFNKPRVPVAQVIDVPRINTGFLTYSPFWILFIANLLQGLASYLPSLYLPTFASDLSLGATSGTLAVSLLNGASVPGLIFLGWLSDRLDVRWSILLSSLGSALSVFLLWGFAKTLLPLLVFACIYGFLATSWCALWPRFVAIVDGDDPRQASTLMSILYAENYRQRHWECFSRSYCIGIASSLASDEQISYDLWIRRLWSTHYIHRADPTCKLAGYWVSYSGEESEIQPGYRVGSELDCRL
ncbi:major facilitator superfamily domain-containing protein [Rhodocollybia butyracea]|uniref:Major facilitator superfamily domain-containing protein n=1 Tax=Rhodocollybia butyracea TaxID=206335 RepID=A0A9P5PXY3_9AGAR|nr:major facilitator superfamily domain-containing protein [Rhodocollybia butyracea]